MTMQPSAIKPLGPSSPFVAGELLDAWGSVLATEADVTSAQRAIEIGSRIPIVFGKTRNSTGGVWVTPAAARFGGRTHPTDGTTVSIGMVVSDGQIGSISSDDVYKGSAKISELLDWKSEFAYGSMPSSGFDYTLSATTVQTKQEFVNGQMTTTYSISRSGVTSVKVINLRVMLGIVTQFFAWRVLVNGTLHSSQSPSVAVTKMDCDLSWAEPTDFTLELTSYNYSLGRPYNGVALLMAEVVHTYLQTGAPEEGATELPIHAGAGGTFADLSCLAIKARAAKAGGVEADADATKTLNKSIRTSVSFAFNNTKSISISDMRVKVGPANYFFKYNLYVNGALAQTSGSASYASSYPPIDRFFSSRVNVVLEIISFSAGEGKPYPAGAVFTGSVRYTTADGTRGGTTLLGYEDQVRCYVANGVYVPSAINGAIGSSDNFADLALYLLRRSGRVPDRLIDLDSFKLAAQFTAVNGLAFNGVLSAPVNLREYFQRVAPYFLLTFTQVNGRLSLLPVVNVKPDGLINTSALTPAFQLDENKIIEGSLSWNYISAAERQTVTCLVTWRNQTTGSYAVTNVVEVKHADTPSTAPTDRHDLSEFCTSFAHAATVGKYVLATKKHVTHSIEFAAMQTAIPGIKANDIIQLNVSVMTTFGDAAQAPQLYRVASISEAETGIVAVRALLLPQTADGRDQVAADILEGTYMVK